MKNLFSYVIVVFLATFLFSCAVPRAGMHYSFYNDSYSGSSYKSSVKLSDEGVRLDNKIGFYIGAELQDVDISDKFSVQPEVNFIFVKDFNQIQVPILARYQFVDKFSATLGPNFGFLFDPAPGINSFNIFADIGVAYNFSDEFSAEARYQYGFSDLSKNDFYSLKVSGFQIGIAYRFAF